MPCVFPLYRRQKISHPIPLPREHIFVFGTTLRARDITISRPRATYFIGLDQLPPRCQLAAFVHPNVPKRHFVCVVNIERHSILAFNFDRVQRCLDVVAHGGMRWDIFLRRVSWRDHQVIHPPVL
jgi:hypothetical protein